MKKRNSGPWPNGYISEIDETEELNAKHTNFNQSLIVILNWIVELGRVVIITETLVRASHLALPRQGQLETALHVFGYLKCKQNARMVFDPTYPDINMDDFKEYDW